MGCFDYECACGGSTCEFKGGQGGGNADVVIEVPLKDGTIIYIEGVYESYGAVRVGGYAFYPQQFEDYFVGWLEDEKDAARANIFRSNRIWTREAIDRDTDSYEYTYTRECYTGEISEFTTALARKCIRADDGLIIQSEDERRVARIAKLKSTIEFMQKELGRINRP